MNSEQFNKYNIQINLNNNIIHIHIYIYIQSDTKTIYLHNVTYTFVINIHRIGIYDDTQRGYDVGLKWV